MATTASSAPKKGNFTLFQILRIAFGVGLLVILGVVYIPYLFFTYSSSAVISARIITLSTPIAGIAAKAPPPPGTELHEGDVIAKFINTTVDRSALGELQIEKDSLSERIAALDKEKATLLTLKNELSKSRDEFVRSRADRLQYDIASQKKRHEELTASMREESRLLDRKNKLYKTGNVSVTSLDDTFFAFERAKRTTEQAQLDLERLIKELEDVKKGIFINPDGRSEVTYQDQRIDEIRIRIADIDARRNEFYAKLQSVMKNFLIEEKRFQGLAERTLKAPKFSVVMRNYVMENTQVEEKEPIVDIIDCTLVYVDMTMHEAYFNKIKIGQRATIKLRGRDTPIHGRVTHVRGGSVFAEPEKGIVGVAPIRRDHEMQVLIDIDEEDLLNSASESCHVGRTGEVIFDAL